LRRWPRRPCGGTLATLLGAVLVILSCWIKARLEESFLRAELGAAAYDAYARRVPMLIPFTAFGRADD
jgi:protein-S-isoprenylcysteine O-methyltransferase Ste14